MCKLQGSTEMTIPCCANKEENLVSMRSFQKTALLEALIPSMLATLHSSTPACDWLQSQGGCLNHECAIIIIVVVVVTHGHHDFSCGEQVSVRRKKAFTGHFCVLPDVAGTRTISQAHQAVHCLEVETRVYLETESYCATRPLNCRNSAQIVFLSLRD